MDSGISRDRAQGRSMVFLAIVLAALNLAFGTLPVEREPEEISVIWNNFFLLVFLKFFICIC
jgi:hypothetical protein